MTLAFFTIILAAPTLFALGLYTSLRRAKIEREMQRHPDILRLKRRLSHYFPEISKIKLLKGTASYTIGKRVIYLCTRDPTVTNSSVYDDNTLTYVFLHELAHVLNNEVGHGLKFRRIFALLLKRANRHGLYNENIPNDPQYCGYRMN